MPSAQEAREARRRKILARGSDRLAFIAGQLPSISSVSPSPVAEFSASPVSADLPSSPTAARSGDEALVRLRNASPSRQAEEFQHFDVKASTRVLKDVRQQLQAIDQESGYVPAVESAPIRQPESTRGAGDERPTSLDSRFDLRGTECGRRETGTKSLKSRVTWSVIGRSIDVTENYRVVGALSLAFFLIAQSFVSSTGAPDKWILPWPGAFVIVTDVSLVLGALILGLAKTPSVIGDVDSHEADSPKEPTSKTLEIATKLEHVFGLGEVLIKTFRALFLDCAIYTVVITSVYSILQMWRLNTCAD